MSLKPRISYLTFQYGALEHTDAPSEVQVWIIEHSRATISRVTSVRELIYIYLSTELFQIFLLLSQNGSIWNAPDFVGTRERIFRIINFIHKRKSHKFIFLRNFQRPLVDKVNRSIDAEDTIVAVLSVGIRLDLLISNLIQK